MSTAEQLLAEDDFSEENFLAELGDPTVAPAEAPDSALAPLRLMQGLVELEEAPTEASAMPVITTHPTLFYRAPMPAKYWINCRPANSKKS